MNDPLSDASPGQASPFVTQTDTVNLTLDAVRRFRRMVGNGRGGTGPLESDPLVPACLVWIRNDTGATLPAFGACKPSEALADLEDVPFAARQQPAFSVIAPTAATDAILIPIDPIDADGWGRAACAGVTVASVNVTDLAHTRAAPGATVVSFSSGTTGPLRLLHAPTETGTQNMLVRLEPAGAPAGVWAARLTTSSGGLWKYVPLSVDYTGAAIDGGGESADYTARPHTINGTELCNPVNSLRVLMWNSSQDGFQEFIPIGMATSGMPGLVSTVAQEFGGDKTFRDVVDVNADRNEDVNAFVVHGYDATGNDAASELITVYSGTDDSGLGSGWQPPFVALGEYDHVVNPGANYESIAPRYPSTFDLDGNFDPSSMIGLSVSGYIITAQTRLHVRIPSGSDFVDSYIAINAGTWLRPSNGQYLGNVINIGGGSNGGKEIGNDKFNLLMSGWQGTSFSSFVQVGYFGSYNIVDLQMRRRLGRYGTFYDRDGVELEYVGGILVEPYTSGTGDGGGGGGGGGDGDGVGSGVTSVTDHGSDDATSASDTVTVTLAGETVLAGSVLWVAASVTDNGGTWTATFDGVPLTTATSGALSGTSVTGVWRWFYLPVVTDTTGDIEISYTRTGLSAGSALVVSALDLVGSTAAIDQIKKAGGGSSAPSSGATGTTTAAIEGVLALAILSDPLASPVTDGTWSGGFTDLHSVGPSSFRMRTGYQISAATGTFTAALTGTTPPGWNCITVTTE